MGYREEPLGSLGGIEMSKKDENVIKQTVTALNRIADTLDDLDTALWTLALEASGVHDKMESLDAKLDKLLSEPLKIDFKTFTKNIEKATPKQKTAKPPTEAFTSV
jgi:hypothetical protein